MYSAKPIAVVSLLIISMSACYYAQSGRASETPLNVILVVSDGMGPEQIKLTRTWLNGNTAPLNFETLPFIASMTTENIAGGITDSAASATAMATGTKVGNGVVAMQIPGNGAELPTVLELWSQHHKSTGLAPSR